MKVGAILSEDRKYRYVLEREWDSKLPKVMFIGLNPSTADEKNDDQTIRRCISFAKSFGYGGFYMTNLFAYRSTDPGELWKIENPVGNDNDSYIEKYSELAERTIACWGNPGDYQGRSKEIKVLIKELYCLGVNKTGEPKHPLRLSKNTQLQRLH